MGTRLENTRERGPPKGRSKPRHQGPPPSWLSLVLPEEGCVASRTPGRLHRPGGPFPALLFGLGLI